MNRGTGKAHMLYDLAQTIAVSGNHLVATALRKLAQAGYTSLNEVDHASDWTLLSIAGIGVARLRVVRQLTRAGWQPPSPHAVKAAGRYLSAIQFALRFWPQETLVALVAGSTPELPVEGPHEGRWALELFSSALSAALPHCSREELVQVLQTECGGH